MKENCAENKKAHDNYDRKKRIIRGRHEITVKEIKGEFDRTVVF